RHLRSRSRGPSPRAQLHNEKGPAIAGPFSLLRRTLFLLLGAAPRRAAARARLAGGCRLAARAGLAGRGLATRGRLLACARRLLPRARLLAGCCRLLPAGAGTRACSTSCRGGLAPAARPCGADFLHAFFLRLLLHLLRRLALRFLLLGRLRR